MVLFALHNFILHHNPSALEDEFDDEDDDLEENSDEESIAIREYHNNLASNAFQSDDQDHVMPRTSRIITTAEKMINDPKYRKYFP